MKATMRVNTSGLRNRLEAIDQASAHAAFEGVKVMGREFGRHLLIYSPTDTNRYKRGWALAINTAGVGPVPVPVIQDSKYADWLLHRLELRLAFFERRLEDKKKAAGYWTRVYDNRYGRQNRTGKWERDCAAKRDQAKKDVDKVTEQVRRAQETVDNFDPKGLVVWGRDSKDGKIRFAEVHTQRLKVYGGTGYAVGRGDTAYIVFHNLEAHASIVEKQQRVVARAFAAVRRPGVKRSVGDKVVREVVKAGRRATAAAAR